MKQFLTFACIIMFTLNAAGQGQDSSTHIFKKFKVDISFGYAIPGTSSNGYNYQTGGLFAIEPKYAIIDQLVVGFRVEGAVIANINTNSNSNNSNGKADLSYILTGDYYFTNTKVRPFVGAGAGIFRTSIIDSTTNNNNINSLPTTQLFGFMIRGGFEWGHLRVGVEYNIISTSVNYFGLKLGVCVGGGRIKREKG